jgi:hypothetical protein
MAPAGHTLAAGFAAADVAFDERTTKDMRIDGSEVAEECGAPFQQEASRLFLEVHRYI